MSSQILTELPSIQMEGMDYNSILAELQQIITNNPKWAENWNSFSSSEAGQMFLQIMSWIADNLSIRQDLLYNEMYLSTAQKRADKIRLLKLIGYQPDLAHSAKTEISIELNSVPDTTVNILKRFSIASDVISARPSVITKFQSNDSTGNLVQWEILPFTASGKPDYLGELTLKAGTTSYTTDSNGSTLYAYQGETKYTELVSNSSDGPYIDLTDSNIAANSIVCYNANTGSKYLQVESFASTDAIESSNAIPYIISLNDDESIRIQFAKKGLLNDNRLLPAGTTVGIFYRTTSGSSGNIPMNYMIGSASLLDSNNKSYPASITNISDAIGGSDTEELDTATLNAPLTLRTLDRAVTAEDFNILMAAYPGILKSKVYTCSNLPNNFRTYFGRNLNPQEALAYVLINRDFSSIPSEEYNNYPWASLYKVPRLNEKYSFTNGETEAETTISQEYYNMAVYLSGEDVRNFNNAIIIDLGVDFNNKILADSTNPQFKLKLSTSLTGETNFNKIAYSLLGDTTDIYSDLSDNKELSFDTNAHFVSKNSYESQFENAGATYKRAYDISDSRYIILSLDNRVEMYIDLFEGERTVEDGAYYIYWDNMPAGDIASANDTSTGAAANRHGILQLINSQMVGIAQGETSNGNTDAAAEYTYRNAYQWMGLNISAPTNIAQNFVFDTSYQRLDLILDINGTTYKFPFKPNSEGLITYQEIVDQLNEYFTDCQYVRYLSDNAWKALESNTALNGLVAGIAPRYNNDSYNQTQDIYLKSSSESFIPSGNLEVEYSVVDTETPSENDIFNGATYSTDKNFASMIHKLHNATESANYASLLGTNFPACSYNDLAELLTDPSDSTRVYLNIKSPLTGENSSIHFLKRDGYESNFIENFLGVSFNSSNETAKAFGQKKVYLATASYLAGYKTDPYSSEDLQGLSSDLSAGNIIFENSCIYNDYDFSNIYASYIFEEKKAIDIGSVYDNFYYTGDSATDENLKDKIAYIDGTVLKDGVVSETASNFNVKLTKEKTDAENYYAIKDDFDAVRSDIVKIATADITESLGTGGISLSFDNKTSIIDCDLSDVSSAAVAISSIQSAISNFVSSEEENEYEDYIKSVNSIVCPSISSINQIYIKNLVRNNGNVTFYYPGKYSTENLKNFYKRFFGTSKTNASFYTLYPASMFERENIISVETNEVFEGEISGEYFYMPTQNAPLKFTYRKLVNGVSTPADYYIKYASEDTNYPFKLVKTEDSNFPTTSFYLHFINDRSLLSDEQKKDFDETAINEYMTNKMISGMNLYFEKPHFKGYDIAATIYYNANYSEATIKSKVEETIKKFTSVENSDIGGYMSQALIIKEIMNCEGVENATITYFGQDFTKPSSYPSTNQLDAKFYELLHINTQDEGKHGLIFSYEMQS